MTQLFEATALSAAVAIWTAVLCVPLALVASTALYGSRWRGLEVLFLVPLFWSPTVSGVMILWSLSPNHPLGRALHQALGQIVFTPSGTVLASLFVSFPLAFQACIIGRARVPIPLQEGSQVLGGTPLFTLVTVVWPQMGGAILGAALLVAARSLGEFGASIMVGGNISGQTQTLPLLIYALAEQRNLAAAALGAAISAALGLLAYAALRRLENPASAGATAL